MQHAAWRVSKPALHAPFALLLQVARGARQRASGAGSGDEAIELAAVGLLPDLRAGRLDVRLAVGGVVELVGPDGVVEALGVPLGLVVVVLRVVERDGGHRVNLGAEHAEEVNLLLRLRVGHVDDTLVPLGAANVREADARVAGGALDDGAAGLDQPLLLGVLHDEESGAVLDAAAGLHELGLAEDLAASLLRELVEPDERRVAHGADEAGDGLHVCESDAREVRGRGGHAGGAGAEQALRGGSAAAGSWSSDGAEMCELGGGSGGGGGASPGGGSGEDGGGSARESRRRHG